MPGKGDVEISFARFADKDCPRCKGTGEEVVYLFGAEDVAGESAEAVCRCVKAREKANRERPCRYPSPGEDCDAPCYFSRALVCTFNIGGDE
jgi:hypothetical protein